MSQPTLTCEGIAVTLAAILQALPGVTTFNRRLRHWSDVTPEETPAAFLSVGHQALQNDDSGAPVRTRFDYLIDLYVDSQDPTTAPSTLLNTYLEMIKTAILPVSSGGPPGFPGTVQVLGDTTGRLRHAWIVGVDTDEGVLGSRAIANVHIEVLLV